MFKKLFSMLLAIIMLILCTTAITATTSSNQKNVFELWGDFENENYWDAITTGKVIFHGTDAFADIANIGADGSSHSLKIDTTNSTSGTFWILRPAVPGETYDLSFKIKTDTPEVSSLTLYNVYDEKTYITDKTINFNSNSGWVEYKSTFTVPYEYENKKIYEGTKFQIDIRRCVLYIDNLCMIPHGNIENADHGQANAGIISYEEGDGVEATQPNDTPSGEAINIYVDALKGDDSYDGTEDFPLASIEAARDLAKEYAPAMQNNIYIKIRGEQYIDETFTLDESNSGQNGYKIIYTSWGDNKATLTMAKKFTGFTLHDESKNIWKINVGKGTYSRTAYFNEALGIRARTVGYLKNVDYIYQSHYLCDNTELLTLKYPQEVEFVYHSKWYNVVHTPKSFSLENERVKIVMNDYFYTGYNRLDYYDKTRNIKRQTPSYLENAYEFLDRSGEWYIDKHEGFLYYIPRTGEVMDTMELKLPIGEEMIMVKGSSNMSPVSHIAFDNLIIDGTTWLRVEEMGGAEFIQNNILTDKTTDSTPGFPDKTSVYFEACRYIDITNCDFRHLGSAGPAVLFYQASKHINIIGNEFYELGGGALEFDYPRNSTPYNRSAASLCEYINIENNYIHDISLDFAGCAALSFGHPRHTKVHHNEISNVPYSGIHSGWGWESLSNTGSPMYDFEISYNYIHDVMNDRLYDGSAIYNVGASSQECDMTPDATNNGANKNRIINNYFVNGWGCDFVYPDNASTSWYVANNVNDVGYVKDIEYNFDEKVTPLSDSYWMHMHMNNIKWITTRNNYAHLDYAYNEGHMRQQESSIEHVKFLSDNEWPAEATAIAAAAGIQDKYKGNFDLTSPNIFASSNRWQSLTLETPTDSELMILGNRNTKYDLSDYDIEWWIDDPDAVTIDENGMITAHKEGTFEAEAFVFVNGLWQSEHFLLECSAAPESEIIENKLDSLADYQMPFDNGASTAIYKSYSWQNATATALTNGNETIQLVEDPKNSSNTVMKLTLAGTISGGSSSLRLNKATTGYFTSAAKGTIPAGGEVIYTFRYYLDNEDYTPDFRVENSIGNTTEYAVSNKSFETKSKTWHEATLVYTNNTTSPQEISSATLKCVRDNSERIIYFDNLKVVINSKVSTLNDYKMDFEGDSSIQVTVPDVGYYNASTTERGSNNEKTQLVDDPKDSNNTVMKVTLSSSLSGSSSTIKFSNTTSTSLNVGTAVGTVPAGGKITFSFRYYFPQEMKSVSHTTANGTEYKPAFSIVFTADGKSSFAVSSTPFETAANQWHTATLTYFNITDKEVTLSPATLRFEGDNLNGKGDYTNWVAEGHSGYDATSNTFDLGERIIYFDDFRVLSEELPDVIGIYLKRGAGGVIVATDQDLDSAKLIIATYDLNNKMIGCYSTDVTLKAQNTKIFAPVDLKAGAITKAMLWDNMWRCIPITDLIQY